jgi:predicted nicotinamide N-methyase
MILILFTTVAPHPLTHELSHQGHTVYEALAVSEIYALADQHPLATVIITADIDPERAKAIKHHYPTLHLKPTATIRDIIWELGQAKGASVH